MKPRLPPSVLLWLVLLAACGKSTPPEPASGSASAPASSSVAAASPGSAERPPRGRPTPPPPSDADVVAVPSRAPDMGLDPTDPARDYVARYVAATSRYGSHASCLTIAGSASDGGNTTVDVKNDPSGACGVPGQTKETFTVDLGADHLGLVDATKREPLRKWPDGSDPEGPAAPVGEPPDIRKWKNPLKEAMVAMKLVPIRLQWYGRGTYPVVTLAIWRDPLSPTASGEDLRAAAEKLCAANGGRPLGFFGGLDRVNMLRIDCPDRTRWEKL